MGDLSNDTSNKKTQAERDGYGTEFQFERLAKTSTPPDCLKHLLILDNVAGVVNILQDWLFILGLVVLCEKMWDSMLWYPVYAASCFLIGWRQFGLYENSHCAIHGTLARNPMWNFFLGTACSGWWVFYGFGDNYEQHVMGHHVKYSSLKSDPVFEGFDFCGLNVKQSPADQRKAYFTFIVDPIRAFHYTYLQIVTTWSGSQAISEIICRTIFLAAMVFLPFQLGIHRQFLLYWVIPFLFVHSKLVLVIDDLHDHWGEDTKRNPTWARNRDGWFMGTHNSNYHVLHHFFPKLPNYRLKEAHNILIRHNSSYRKLPFYNSWSEVHRSMFQGGHVYN